MQDSRGFLWVSTGEGLARFNGNRFTVYRHSRADTNSMPFNNVGSCIELKNHHLVFNSAGKMWMLNPFNHQQYAPPNFWREKSYAVLTHLSRQLIAIRTKDKTYFTDMDLQVIDSVTNPFPVIIVEMVYLGNNNVLFSNNHNSVCYSLVDKKMEAGNIEEKYFSNTNGFGIKHVDTINKLLYAVNYFSGIFTISYNREKPAYLKPISLSTPWIGGTKTLLYKNDDLIVSGDYQLVIFKKDKPPMVIDNPINTTNNLPGGGGELFADNNDNIWITGHNGISSFKLNQLNYQYWKLPYPADRKSVV